MGALGLAGRSGRTLLAELLDFFVKRLDVLEVSVDRRETYVGHFVQLTELIHDELADDARLNFTLAQTSNLVSDAADRLVEHLAGNRTLFQRFLHAPAQFGFVEVLASAIPLHHDRHHELSRLERGETLATGQTFAAPTNLPALTRQARVVDLGLDVPAERTMHPSRSGGRRQRRRSAHRLALAHGP